MKYKKILTLISVLSLSACDIGTPPEIKELRRLCALDAGQKVYETVQADGYFDADENGQLVIGKLIAGYDTSKYQYIEFCKDKPMNPYSDTLKIEQGCYRAEKVKRDSGLCNADADKHMIKHNYTEFSKNQCITVNKIEKPGSRFYLKTEIEKWMGKNIDFQYSRYNIKIKDQKENKTVGEQISYLAFKKPNTFIGCGDPAITGLKENITDKESIISRTLKTNK